MANCNCAAEPNRLIPYLYKTSANLFIMNQPPHYDLFIQLFESFRSTGFQSLDPTDSLIIELDEKMKANKQFIIIADMMKVQVLYASQGYTDFFGDLPMDSYPLVNFERSHPDIKERHSVARTKLFKMSQDMFINQWPNMLVATNLIIKDRHEKYVDLMFQAYLVYSEIPYRSVFVVLVHTDISEIPQMKYGYHFYSGPDLSYFRFPDHDLLMSGNIFTNREYEIINCIAEGLDSEQIAGKLFISRHTVNTHRRNVLNKTGKRNTHELILDLKQKGVI
jgi:DNA-binding CsgD family transcriptional regulator